MPRVTRWDAFVKAADPDFDQERAHEPGYTFSNRVSFESGQGPYVPILPSPIDVAVEVVGVSGEGQIGLAVVAEPLTLVFPVGVSGTGHAGTVTAIGNAVVAVLGVSGTGHAGTPQALAPNLPVDVLGVSGTGAVGTVAVVGSAVVAVTGVSGTGRAGTVTVPATNSIVVAVTGVSGTGHAGTVTIGVIAPFVANPIANQITTDAQPDIGVFWNFQFSSVTFGGTTPFTYTAGTRETRTNFLSNFNASPVDTTHGSLQIVASQTLPDTMTATFTGLPGGPFTFTESTATAATNYITPSGSFIQQHRIASHASLPTMKVHFCRDVVGTRREIWVYHGTLESQPASDLPSHSVSIKEGATTLTTQSVPSHVHRTWWRWQEGGSRPVINTVASLIAAQKIPPFDVSLAAIAVTNDWSGVVTMPSPMGSDGIQKDMRGTGERWDLGPLNGTMARYVVTGADLSTVMATAECAAAMPVHLIDEGTGKPFQISAHDDPHFSWDHLDKSTLESTWTPDSAHLPNTVTMAGLLTEDPFYTMLAQGQAAYTPWEVDWQRWPEGDGDFSVGPNLSIQTRGWAWVMRDLLVSWLLTPAGTVPSWLLSRTEQATMMTGICAWLRDHQFAAGHPEGTFHLTQIENTPATGVALWQENFFSNVLGWWAWAGAPGNADDLFAYKVDTAIATAGGRDGYPRQYTATYWTPPQAWDPSSDWGDVIGNAGWSPPVGPNLQGENSGGASPPDWYYASYALGALEWAIIHGVGGAEAVAGRDYMRAQVRVTGHLDNRYAWTEEAT